MQDRMTSRERWLATLDGQPVDRLAFWPKLDAAYPLHQRGRFAGWTNQELHAWIGSDVHAGGPNGVREVRDRTRVTTAQADGLRRTIYETPAGNLTYVERYDRASASYHPYEFPVKTAGDIEAMTWVHADVRYVLDEAQVERAEALMQETGEGGIVTTSLGISPLMDWLQHIAGVENGHLLLVDEREAVETLFQQMHAGLCRRAEIIAGYTPYPLVYSVENTSTTLISPAMFRRYCLPHLRAYGEIIRGAGKHHVLHMCGKLKELLPDIGTLPASAIEAFTSPPVGSTTLLDGRTACPNLCFIGGTNATLWLEPAETIIETIASDLAALPHQRGIVVTSAGVMPPFCQPETIKAVADWIKEYPVA